MSWKWVSISIFSALITWAAGFLVVSYSAGTPSYGFPLHWKSVGSVQGCLLVSPGCATYVYDWASLAIDMLLLTTAGFAITAICPRATKSVSLGLPRLLDRKTLRIIMVNILISIALLPIVALAEGPVSSCVNCRTGYESLELDSYHVNSPTNVTLVIKNTASLTIALVNYEVKDGNGNIWWRIWFPPNESAGTSWSGPTMTPNTLGTGIITIGSACGNCTYQGATGAFNQFNGSGSYTVTVVTARNEPFAFLIQGQSMTS